MSENMSPMNESLTPSQRLELSRRALLDTLHPGSPRQKTAAAALPDDNLKQAGEQPLDEPAHADAVMAVAAQEPPQATSRAPMLSGGHGAEQNRPARRMMDFSRLTEGDTAKALSTGAVALQRLLNAWWRRHPLHVVADIGEPLVQKYARRHPYRLLAIAAAIGATVVVLKPWRWNGTRRWARSTLSREVQGMNFSRLSQMVVDSLLHNGKR